MDWKEDEDLLNDLKGYVAQNVKRIEILDYMTRDFGEYKWSLPTLDRRMRYFNIFYIDRDTTVEEVQTVISAELQGPGKLLGYRSMNQKLRQEHKIHVPRHLVYNVMSELDPEGLASRSVTKKKKIPKQPFTSKGPLWMVSVDGHDKLCGYQNSTFPLGIYGFIDTFSRKILSLFVLESNSNPYIIGDLYITLLRRLKETPVFLRMDKGTETGKMATIHSYLMSQVDVFDDATDAVIYGPSTSNKIERWWRDLHERLEKYFKYQLKELLNGHKFIAHDPLDRKMLAYIYIPIIQRECDIFVAMWNSHRIRKQKDLELPTGVPNHMFSFPDKYNAQMMGLPFNDADITEVIRLSGVNGVDINATQLSEEEMELFQTVIPDPIEISSKDAITAYLDLRREIRAL